MLTVRMHNGNKPQDLKFYPQCLKLDHNQCLKLNHHDLSLNHRDLELNLTSTHGLCSGSIRCQQISQTPDSGGWCMMLDFQ